jgi:hypothetical protein
MRQWAECVSRSFVVDANGIAESKSEGSIFSSEIQAAVKAELEMVLSSPVFAQSNRCKRFLSHVVLQTLSGRAGELKERTIGINVFDRANDYDTGGDSIVRVTSNEVRKRIGQFYGESEGNHTIQIELPRGSYVPEFKIHPNRNRIDVADLPAESHALSQPIAEGAAAVSEASPPLLKQSETSLSQVHQDTVVAALGPAHSRKFQISVALLVFALITAVAVFSFWESQTQRKTPEVWEGFQRAGIPVLICIGTHNIPSSTPNASPNEETRTFDDLVLRREIIPVDDVTVITSVASLLGKKDIRFRVVGADQTSLTDLRRQPVILIGGADNKWTLRLTQELRYRIEFIPPAVSKEPTAWIMDSEQPNSIPWKISFSVPMYEWKNDYAIVARVDDPTTGVPVLIDAGLGNLGSIAASELIASDTLPKQLASEPGCRGKTNFEAVVGTEIIDAKPGPPHILRLHCW